MRKAKLIVSTLALLAVSFTTNAYASKPFKNGEMTVTLDSPISTKLNKVGDSFVARVTAPAELQGAIVEGHIRKVEPAQNGTAPKARVAFGFETITIGDNTYKIQADLKSVSNAKGMKDVDDEGQAIAKGNGMKKALFGAGGAGIGSLAGGMIGGGIGSLAGGMAGGALGYVISLDLTANSKDIDFFPGSSFAIMVTDKGENKDVKAGDVRNLDADAIAAEKTSPAAARAANGGGTPAPAAPSTSTVMSSATATTSDPKK